MSKNSIRRKRYTVKQDSGFLQITVFPKKNWLDILVSAINVIICSLIFSVSVLTIFFVPISVALLGFSIFNFLRETLCSLLGKEIIRVDRNSLSIEFRICDYRLEKQSFDQAEIFNFQVCCLMLQESKPIRKDLSGSEEIYALSFCPSEEGGVVFARDLCEQDVAEIMRLAQRYMPSISYRWEIDENKLTWLIQILTQFALLSRFGKRTFNDLLLSNIPDEFIEDVFQANPWLPIYLYALASRKKPPLLNGVPIIYTEYLRRIWRAVATNEDTIWDVVRSIPKSLLQLIVKRN